MKSLGTSESDIGLNCLLHNQNRDIAFKDLDCTIAI